MDDNKKTDDNQAKKDLLWAIGLLIVLFLLWVLLGGPKISKTESPFLKSPLSTPPLDSEIKK